MYSGHEITRHFEAELCAYTGAPYAVTTTSCTMAILLACAYQNHYNGRARYADIWMPDRSYVGVPAAIKQAGYEKLKFERVDWVGEYEIKPLGIWDSARRFTSGMYRGHRGDMQCVSFHWSKILGLSQGGAILLDNRTAAEWLRRARFDGRGEGADPKTDEITYPSWHAYLSPEIAAHGLMKLATLSLDNADLPNSDYPYLSRIKAFQCR